MFKENESKEQYPLSVHGDGPILEDIVSDDESSTTSYHGSPKEDGDNFHSMMHESSSDNAQVLVTGTSTIEEQLSNLLEMVEKLTRTVEEKDVQIAELYSKL